MPGRMGWAAATAAIVAGLLPGAALAATTLTVNLAGEAYNGPPQFDVTFNGRPLGEKTVTTAIDAGTAGRFADAQDKAKYVTSFDFTIPDDAFKPDGIVAIHLANADRGDKGLMRELFVRSVAINGKELPASSFSMRSDAGVEPTAMLGDYLVVSDDAISGIALPADGWPDSGPAASVASAAPSPTVAPPAAPVPAVLDTAARDEAADANPDPEANEPACGIDKRFEITGFSRNSNDLTPRVMKVLDAVAKTIGTQKCVVHVTGYSSTEGDYAHNALFSIERSRKALDYLAEHGVKFRKFSANGVGETTQFGSSPAANRRVVVAVSP